jgi:hypothetical protein
MTMAKSSTMILATVLDRAARTVCVLSVDGLVCKRKPPKSESVAGLPVKNSSGSLPYKYNKKEIEKKV